MEETQGVATDVPMASESTRDRLASLYAEHVRWATRLAFLITQDNDLAQDVTQDAFVRVFGRFKDRVPPDEFAAYLRRTIVNLCNDYWRRKKIERAHEEANQDSPIIQHRDLDARSDLVEALRRLPVRQRTVLVLKHFEGLTEHHIAELLGCSVGAVKGLTTRGLSSLRDDMGGTYG